MCLLFFVRQRLPEYFVATLVQQILLARTDPVCRPVYLIADLADRLSLPVQNLFQHLVNVLHQMKSISDLIGVRQSGIDGIGVKSANGLDLTTSTCGNCLSHSATSSVSRLGSKSTAFLLSRSINKVPYVCPRRKAKSSMPITFGMIFGNGELFRKILSRLICRRHKKLKSK